MMSSFRQGNLQVLLKYVIAIALLAVPVATVFIQVYDSFFGQKKQAMVTVNEYEITQQDYQRKVKELEQRIEGFKQQFGEYANMLLSAVGMDQDPRQMALDTLIENKLLLSEAKKLGIDHVSPAYMAEKINDQDFMLQSMGDIVPPYVFDSLGGINERTLREHLRRMGITFRDFEGQVIQEIKKNIVTALIKGTIYVSDAELREQFLQTYAQKQFDYIVVRVQRYIDAVKKAGVSDDEIRAFYSAQNKASRAYWEQERRSIAYWKFQPQDYGLQTTDEKIKAYYDRHKNEYIEKPAQVELRNILLTVGDADDRSAVQEKAEKLQQELAKDPSLFAQKARALSADKDTAQNGGYIGFLSRKSDGYSDEFIQKAFGLKKDGSISSVISTDRGFEIIGRIGKRDTAYKPFAKVKDDIRSEMEKKRFDQRFITDARRTVSRASSDKSVIDSFVSRRNGKKSTMADIAKNDTSSTLKKKAFTLAKEGKRAAFVGDGVGYIVELDAIKPAYLPSLESVKEQVTNDFYAYKAHESLQRDMQKAKQLIEDGSKAEAASVLDASFTQTQSFAAADDKKIQQELKDVGLPVQRMQHMIHPDYAITQLGDKQGVLVMLSKIEDIDFAQFDDVRNTLRSDLYTKKSETIFDTVIASLYKNAIIEYDKSGKQAKQNTSKKS
jgi:peptidyl-prolyl cis-trans isomerase D